MPIKENSTGFKHLLHATSYSLQGLKASFLEESAFRQELLLGIILIPLTWCLNLALYLKLLLTLDWFILLATELLNTGIEAIVDLASPERQPLAKKAKDCGSAAIFCIIASSVFLWTFAIISLF